MDPVVHFEMPYRNPARLVNFYSQAFGWQMQKQGQDMGDYETANTTETDKKKMAKTPQQIFIHLVTDTYTSLGFVTRKSNKPGEG